MAHLARLYRFLLCCCVSMWSEVSLRGGDCNFYEFIAFDNEIFVQKVMTFILN